MTGFSQDLFLATLALIGGVIAVATLFSGLIEKSGLPQVAVFLGLGLLVGPHGLGLLEVGLDSPVLRVVATLGLVFVLFTDAVSLSLREVRAHRSLAFLALGPGTVLSALLVTLAAMWLLDLPWVATMMLGAALASTDPVLLRGVVRDDALPAGVRQTLRLESGLNDVVLLPVVLVGMALSLSGAGGLDTPGDWAGMGLRTFLLGPGAGVAVGLAGIGALEAVRKRLGVRRDYESLYSLGVVFAAYAAAEALHASGFLAAFAAGLTIAALDVKLCDCFLEYGETTGEMLLLFTFVLLGAGLIWQGVAVASPQTLAFAALVFLVRPVAFLLAFTRSRLSRDERLLIAWFGPRGLSSLLLILLPVFAGLPGAEQLFAVTCLVVLLSVALHGGSVMWLHRRRVRAAGGERPAAAASGEWRPATPEAALPALTRGGADTVAAGGEGGTAASVTAAAQWAREREGVVFLDVRSDRDYADSDTTVEGAVRIPPRRAAPRVAQLGLRPDATLIAFCACPEDVTARRVAEELRRAGWPRAYFLDGGWDAWRQARLPMAAKPLGLEAAEG